MYGSNFCRRTRSPRCSSSIPIEAQVSPLPSELTTPPVTKICLAMEVPSPRCRPWLLLYPRGGALTNRPISGHGTAKTLVFLQRVNAPPHVLHDADLDRHTAGQ